MTKKFFTICIVLLPLWMLAEGESPFPCDLQYLYENAVVKPLSNDSLRHYIWQDQSLPGNTTAMHVLECNVEGTSIMIYMLITGRDIRMYACTNPFINPYPPTLLLGSYNEAYGVENWFEVIDGKICTYSQGNFGELIPITKQEFIINDGKFELKSDCAYTVITDDRCPSELWAALAHKDNLQYLSRYFLGIRNLYYTIWGN